MLKSRDVLAQVSAQMSAQMPEGVKRPVLKGVAAFKRIFQQSSAAFIALSALVGAVAGLLVAMLSQQAFNLQLFLYGFSPFSRLSAAPHIALWRLLALPLGGILVGAIRWGLAKRQRPPIDVIEANALFGGRIPLRDSLIVTIQTLISNGFGTSVGLEAAYAQMGGGAGSRLGQWLNLKRASLRTLVGAGAGAAIGAAFGAPLAGAFYGFEIVLGAYSPASLAPVAVASLAATLTAQLVHEQPFVVVSTLGNDISLAAYGLYIGLGLICALIGIGAVRLVATAEAGVRTLPISDPLKPVAGGIILMGLAWLSPQILSSGHGAMQFVMAQRLGILMLMWVFALKLSASVVSLGFGFRGGLFFASLFLGSLLGSAYAQVINHFGNLPHLDITNAALVGMAALATAIVGGPMCLSLMVLEVTHDFALTAAVVMASVSAQAFVRANFGYSFSTWRLHLRGEAIRTARDIGWMKTMTAKSLMREPRAVLADSATIAELRTRVPLGSTSRVALTDANGHYRGLILTPEAYMDGLDPFGPALAIARWPEVHALPETDIGSLIALFDDFGCDDLAVVDEQGRLLGLASEKYVRRRYLEALERSQREFFGEV